MRLKALFLGLVLFAAPAMAQVYDANGKLVVSTDYFVFVDDAAFTLTSSSVGVVGAIRDDTLGALAAAEGDAVPLRVNSTGALHVTGGGGGTEYTEDAITANPQVGTATMIEMDTVLSAVVPVDGDWIGLRGSGEGALWTQDFNSDAILADTTAILLDTASMDTNLGTVAGAVAAGQMQVDIVADGAGLALAASQLADGHNVTVDNGAAGAAVNIQDGGNAITVDGTVTVTDGAGALNVIVDSATLGTVTTTPNVVGTGTEATAQRVTIATDSTGVLSVDDNAGTLTVDSGATFTVQEDGALLTAAQLSDDVVYIDDADWTDTTSKHALVGGVYQSVPQTITDGDVGPLSLTSDGQLRVVPEGTLGVVEQFNLANSDPLAMALVDGNGDQISSFAGPTEYTEDSVHASGDTLNMAGVVQQTSDAALSGNGDRSLLQVDETGYLKVNVKEVDAAGTIDDTTTHATGTTQGTPIMAAATPTDTAVDANDLGVVAMSLDRRLLVDADITASVALDVSAATVTVSDGAGAMNVIVDSGTTAVTNAGTFAVQVDSGAFIQADDAAFTLTTSGVAVAGAIRDDALSTLAAIENDAVPLRVSSTGALHVTGGGGGTEYTTNATVPTDPVGATFTMEIDTALTTLSTEVETDWTNPRSTLEGALWTQDFNSDAILADTAAMDTNLATIAGAVSTEMQVDVVTTAGLTDTELRATPVPVSGTVATTNAIVDGTAYVDDGLITLASDSGIGIMGVFTGDVVDAGDVAFLAMSNDRRLLTDTEITRLIPGVLAGDLGKQENLPFNTGDTGVGVWAVRDDALTTLTPIDGDYVPLRVGSTGALHVTGGGGGTEYTDDTSTHATGTSVGAAMVAAATPTDGSVDANDFGVVAMSLDRRLLVDADFTASVALDVSAATVTVSDGAGAMNVIVDSATLGTVTTTPAVVGTGTEATAQRVTIATDSTGVLSVDDNAGALTVDWAGTAPPIGASTEATALLVTVATDSTGLLSVDDNGGNLSVDWAGTVPPIGAGTEAAALRVTMATDSTGVMTVDGTVTATVQGQNATAPIYCTDAKFLNMTTATTTQIIAAVGGDDIYICGYSFQAGGTTTANLVAGAGSDCVTTPEDIAPDYELTAQTGIVENAGGGSIVAKTLTTADAVCVTNSAAVNLRIRVSYAQF